MELGASGWAEIDGGEGREERRGEDRETYGVVDHVLRPRIVVDVDRHAA